MVCIIGPVFHSFKTYLLSIEISFFTLRKLGTQKAIHSSVSIHRETCFSIASKIDFFLCEIFYARLLMNSIRLNWWILISCQISRFHHQRSIVCCERTLSSSNAFNGEGSPVQEYFSVYGKGSYEQNCKSVFLSNAEIWISFLFSL